jgi:hypothetical protein
MHRVLYIICSITRQCRDEDEFSIVTIYKISNFVKILRFGLWVHLLPMSDPASKQFFVIVYRSIPSPLL